MLATEHPTSEQCLALPDEFDKHGGRIKDLAAGSQLVWVVYPDARSVMVHTSDSVRELKAGQKIEDPLLPGFSTPVSASLELT